MSGSAAALLARGLDPQPGPARELLRRELAKGRYAGGATVLDRVLDWVTRHWRELNDSANHGASTLSTALTAVLAVAVIALLAYVLPRVRHERRADGPGAVLEDPTLTAQDYRARATAALGDGRYDVAVVEGFRAIARAMTDRTLLAGGAGQTAHEMGASLAAAFRSHAVELSAAADLFDAVRYGHASAGHEQAEAVLTLDADLAGARPDLVGGPPAMVRERSAAELSAR